jgi:hypothetical protein
MKGEPKNRLGFDTKVDGAAAEYFWKNGGCPDYEGKGRGCSTIAMVFPGDTQLYITVNSTNNASADLTTVASSALDAALR